MYKNGFVNKSQKVWLNIKNEFEKLILLVFYYFFKIYHIKQTASKGSNGCAGVVMLFKFKKIYLFRRIVCSGTFYIFIFVFNSIIIQA